MSNPLNQGAPKSGADLVKEAKELINKVEKVQKSLTTEPCALKNPCVFGKFNPNFDKYKSI